MALPSRDIITDNFHLLAPYSILHYLFLHILGLLYHDKQLLSPIVKSKSFNPNNFNVGDVYNPHLSLHRLQIIAKMQQIEVE